MAEESAPIAATSTGTSWSSSDVPLVQAHDALLLDLDGVVYLGPEPVVGAVEALTAVRGSGARVVFVTNNAARPARLVAEHLTELGMPAEASDVVTSSQAAAAMLAAELATGSPVLVVGTLGLTEALKDVGLVPVDSMDDEPVAVVQGFSPQLAWPALAEACVAVRAGLPWIATNLDATLPTPRGQAPGNGAFVDVVRRTTGGAPRVAGKPFRPLLDEASRRVGASRPLMVGDRLDTDLAGARAAGMPGLLVLTGVSAVVDLLAARPGERPSFLAAGLSGLLQPHRAPQRDGDGWRAPSGARARWDGDRLVLCDVREAPDGADGADGADGTDRAEDAQGADDAGVLDLVRLVCAAVWDRSDGGLDAGWDAGSHAESHGRADEQVRAQAREVLAPWTAPRGWDR
jgi:HAD superfamily hydrolase (TIGR01450 family)